MQTEQIRDWVIDALDELKAHNVVCLDVQEKTSVTDYMIIATGTSSRHVKSLADSVESKAKNEGVKPLGSEGASQAEWVLIDLGAVVVHVMTAATREFYDLERLWADPIAAVVEDVES